MVEWKKEISRDLMALGSWPFLLLVVVRVYIADNYLQLFQMVFGVLLLLVVGFAWKGVDQYAGRIVILGVFSSLFYNETKFTVMAIVTGAIGIFGMYRYLERKGVLIGVLVGGVISLIGYFVSLFVSFENL